MLTPQVNNCFELPRSRLDEWWSFEMKRIGGGGKARRPQDIQFRGGRLQGKAHLAAPMQNIGTKVFQLTAENAADKHQLHQLRHHHQLRYQHQLRCQHAGNGGPAEVKLKSTSCYKSKALSEFLCKPLLAIVTALNESKKSSSSYSVDLVWLKSIYRREIHLRFGKPWELIISPDFKQDHDFSWGAVKMSHTREENIYITKSE